LLSFLQRSANDARQHRQRHEDEERPERGAETRRINNLLAAVEAGKAQIGELESWSDRGHVLEAADDPSLATRQSTAMFDGPAPEAEVEDDPVQEIKGISEKADLKGEHTSAVFNQAGQPSIENKEQEKKEDKGKGRATEHESEDDQIEADPAPHLGPDQVLVPDED